MRTETAFLAASAMVVVGINGLWLSGVTPARAVANGMAVYNAVTTGGTVVPLTVTGASSPNGAFSVTPNAIAITQTETTIPATTSTPITVLTSRKFLSMTNDGVNPCRVSYGAAATATNGEPLAAAAAANGQGGARTFDASAVPQVTVYAYCASASSFAVLEGQ